MFSHPQQPPPPSADPRWENVVATMRRHGNAPSGLIETLHAVQQEFGWLDESALRFVAAGLRVPLSKVYGVATFYHFFTLTPPGVHRCEVCTGTACHLAGASDLLEAVHCAAHLAPGEVCGHDGVTLGVTRCMGLCWLAPAAVLDGHAVGPLQPDTMREKIADWVRHDA